MLTEQTRKDAVSLHRAMERHAARGKNVTDLRDALGIASANIDCLDRFNWTPETQYEFEQDAYRWLCIAALRLQRLDSGWDN